MDRVKISYETVYGKFTKNVTMNNKKKVHAIAIKNARLTSIYRHYSYTSSYCVAHFNYIWFYKSLQPWNVWHVVVNTLCVHLCTSIIWYTYISTHIQCLVSSHPLYYIFYASTIVLIRVNRVHRWWLCMKIVQLCYV